MSSVSTNDVVVISQQRQRSPAARRLANASYFEAEDVLVSSGGVDRVWFELEHDSLEIRLRHHVGGALRSMRARTSLPPIRCSELKLDADYRVAIAIVRTVWDITMLETVGKLRTNADRVIVWVFEMWPSEVGPSLAKLPFHLVDLVLTGPTPEAAKALDALVDPPVRFMPNGVDIDTFGLKDLVGNRPIDLLNIGRRDPSYHRRFLEEAQAGRLSYHFDTTDRAMLADHLEHRWLLAQQYLHSKVAVACAAKFDALTPDESLRAVPNRVFEAMASGTLMVGAPPPSESNQLLVTDEVVVHPLSDEPAEAVADIQRLAASDNTDQRLHLAAVARKSHDWSERWCQIFALAETNPTAGVLERQARMHTPQTSG